jgi:glutamate N-acetyltransferase / amino-acid N-acetyltransferase
MKPGIKLVKDGGVTSAQGFIATGVAAGIKKTGHRDIALVVSTGMAEIAATYTTNQVKAAPVKVSMQHSRNGGVRGVIINAGNANACTGLPGLRDAQEMTKITATCLGCKPKEILVCSTGRIGVPMPMPKIRRGIKKAYAKLDPNGGAKAAAAIMTSDTYKKEIAVEIEIGGQRVVIGGMAKGAGMIHPNMATMLCVITTDAAIDKLTLRRCTEDGVESSFNRISVDGDTSTNDSVIVLANGQAKNELLTNQSSQLELFSNALRYVMRSLARMIVEDGEGISKVIEVAVKGAANFVDAKAATQAVANSTLVKCAWYGEDPNWGRIMDALGYSKARIQEELVEIYYNGLQVVANGRRSKVPEARIRKIAKLRSFTITINLHLGEGEYSILTTDLTELYVTLNKGE